MAVILFLPSAFDDHRRESEIIGRLVTEYGELEWTLCLIVGAALGDLDPAVKAMYRTRGETARIDIGDALARAKLKVERLRNIYATTIDNMRKCLSIRNKYAHAHWSRIDQDLSFLDIENLAKQDAPIDLSRANRHLLSLEILEDQQRFFHAVNQNLTYLYYEIMNETGQAKFTGFHYVDPLEAPKLAVKVVKGAAD